LSIGFVILTVSLVSGDDTKSKDFPEKLKGNWGIEYVSNKKQQSTSFAKPTKLTISDGSAEWESLDFISEKKGKGTLTAKKGDGDTGTLELTIDKKAYKGIYKISKSKDKDAKETLIIAFGAEGADAPKEMPKDTIRLSADVKYYYSARRMTK
jgi:hypothetical protein